MLCVSLTVGAMLVATIALAALDRQRRLFFVSHAQGPDGDPKIVDESGGRRARLRHTLSTIWRPIVRITSYPAGVRVPSAVRRREHAARLVLRVVGKDSARPNLLPMKPPESFAQKGGTKRAPFETAPEETGPPQGERLKDVDDTPSTARPEEPPSFGGVSKDAGRDFLGKAPPETTDPPTGTLTGPQSAGDLLASNASAAEGIVRVDRRGQLKSADPIARDLLHWDRGELTLSAILGGAREAAAMLETLARQAVVEQTVTVRNGASAEQLHATALASRGSDGGLSGVVLFLRRL